MRNYKVNEIISYRVPGVVLGIRENVFNTPAKITRIYDNIKCDDGVIVDMELLYVPGVKSFTGKLLHSENYSFE